MWNTLAVTPSSEWVVQLILIALTILPSFWLGFYVYRKDVVEKESTLLLVKLFSFGIISVIPVLILSAIYESLFSGISSVMFEAFIGIALIEEGTKWFFVKKLTWNNKEFNYIYDAIVYSVFLSLGFATFENFLYVFQADTPILVRFVTAIIRAISSVPGHAFFAVFMGYYLGLAKLSFYNHRPNLIKRYLLFSFVVPICCHGFFDFCLMTQSSLFIVIFFLFVLFLYYQSYKNVKRHSNILSSFPKMVEEQNPSVSVTQPPITPLPVTPPTNIPLTKLPASTESEIPPTPLSSTNVSQMPVQNSIPFNLINNNSTVVGDSNEKNNSQIS